MMEPRSEHLGDAQRLQKLPLWLSLRMGIVEQDMEIAPHLRGRMSLLIYDFDQSEPIGRTTIGEDVGGSPGLRRSPGLVNLPLARGRARSGLKPKIARQA